MNTTTSSGKRHTMSDLYQMQGMPLDVKVKMTCEGSGNGMKPTMATCMYPSAVERILLFF